MNMCNIPSEQSYGIRKDIGHSTSSTSLLLLGVWLAMATAMQSFKCLSINYDLYFDFHIFIAENSDSLK
jgi:hypothetical protein